MAYLITVNEYKDYVGIASSDQDAKITSIIKYVSDLIKQYCNRNFIDNYSGTAFTNITEYWNGGFTHYYTKEFPLVSVVSVSYSLDYGVTYTALTANTDYTLDAQNDRIFILNGESLSKVNAYKIVYTGGYKESPAALKVATLDLVKYYMKQEDVPRKAAGTNVVLEYITTSDLPPHIKRVLDLYRVI